MIWDQKHECMSRDELEMLQLGRLINTVSRCYNLVPHYISTMDEVGVTPSDIRSLGDIRKLPFTNKEALRSNYPYGLFAVPMKEVVRMHTSTGTTGKPTLVGYTRNDLDVWAEVCARLISAAGVTSDDVAQIAFNYGLFTGGLGMHQGMERVGASVIPSSTGNTHRQLTLMQDFGATVLTCTPSYALHLADEADEMGMRGKLNLKWGLFGAEPWTDQMRTEIEEKLGLCATDNYGLSEVIGPGVAGECHEYRDGMHIAEDHFLVEIIDPETLEPLEYGKQGELVITTLTKEAMPVIRYRTGDITRLNPEPCKCRRAMARMERVTGRTDDMLIIRGVNVFPSQVESALFEIEGTKPHYMLVVYREGALDGLEVWVEVSEELFSDEIKNLHRMEEMIAKRLQSVLDLSVKVKLVEPRTIARSEGKAKRVIDLRDEK